ncbi:MAG: argininosuccinate lyase [Actinobacteria bacterium]|nr:argininosuccinate lyase [Actinomycetota bacterium]
MGARHRDLVGPPGLHAEAVVTEADDAAPDAEGRTLWHGRFAGGPAEELLAYTVSLPYDRRLAADDIQGSRAHVRGLVRGGILDGDEAAAVLAALDEVEDELAAGRFAFAASDEDIHTAVERRVTELAGAPGAKLHTGRSRNDQVATDLRLYVKRALVEVAERVLHLQGVLLDRAREAGDAYVPGYTHLQRAQPVLLAHHLLAHGWALARDVDRLLATRARADVSPLGAGALAGSSLPLDPSGTAADLGFAAVFDNSLDAVSDRDFVAEALFDLALLGVHLSRIGEEVVLWSTDEFGFLKLDDAYATGSSMLPQKKNPDIAELARGRSGRLIGHLTAILTTLKGLPLAYNRDLQEDKEPLFDAVDQSALALGALGGLLATSRFEVGAMAAAADTPYAAATDLAELLVEGGTPFREAHAIVGEIVRTALEGHGTMADLVAAHPKLGPDAATLLEPGVSVTRRTTRGGAGPIPVAAQLDRFAERLRLDRERVGGA